MDSAELFLARYRDQIDKAMQSRPAQPKADETPAVAEEAPAKVAPAPIPSEPVVGKTPASPVEQVAAVSAPPLPSADRARPANLTLFSEGARYLRRRGESVAKLDGGDAVVTHCVDAVEHLIDLFSNDESGCKVADGFLDDLMEASDLMVLMQSETGEDPPADAATLLLQLRREMDEKIAA